MQLGQQPAKTSDESRDLIEVRRQQGIEPHPGQISEREQFRRSALLQTDANSTQQVAISIGIATTLTAAHRDAHHLRPEGIISLLKAFLKGSYPFLKGPFLRGFKAF